MIVVDAMLLAHENLVMHTILRLVPQQVAFHASMCKTSKKAICTGPSSAQEIAYRVRVRQKMVTQDCLGVSGAEVGVGAGETGKTPNSISCDCSVPWLLCSGGAYLCSVYRIPTWCSTLTHCDTPCFMMHTRC